MQRTTQRRIKLLDLSVAGSLVKEILVPDVTLRVDKTKLIARLVLRQKGKIYRPIFQLAELVFFRASTYMLFTGWEVRIVKNCDRGLENATRGRRPRAAFSIPRSQFFTIRTDPKPVNNLFIFFLLG